MGTEIRYIERYTVSESSNELQPSLSSPSETSDSSRRRLYAVHEGYQSYDDEYLSQYVNDDEYDEEMFDFGKMLKDAKKKATKGLKSAGKLAKKGLKKTKEVAKKGMAETKKLAKKGI